MKLRSVETITPPFSHLRELVALVFFLCFPGSNAFAQYVVLGGTPQDTVLRSFFNQQSNAATIIQALNIYAGTNQFSAALTGLSGITNLFIGAQSGEGSNTFFDYATITNLQEVGPATNAGSFTVTGRITNTVLTSSQLVGTDANGALQSITLGTGLSFVGTTLNASAGSGGIALQNGQATNLTVNALTATNGTWYGLLNLNAVSVAGGIIATADFTNGSGNTIALIGANGTNLASANLTAAENYAYLQATTAALAAIAQAGVFSTNGTNYANGFQIGSSVLTNLALDFTFNGGAGSAQFIASLNQIGNYTNTNGVISIPSTLASNQLTSTNIFIQIGRGTTNQIVLQWGSITNTGWLSVGSGIADSGSLLVTGKITNSVLTASQLVGTDANGALQSITLGTGLSFAGTTLNASAGSGGIALQNGQATNLTVNTLVATNGTWFVLLNLTNAMLQVTNATTSVIVTNGGITASADFTNGSGNTINGIGLAATNLSTAAVMSAENYAALIGVTITNNFQWASVALSNFQANLTANAGGLQLIANWTQFGNSTNTNGFFIDTNTVGYFLVSATNVLLQRGVGLTNTVSLSNGNIIVSGNYSGNGSGLTNATGNGYVDLTITNALSTRMVTAGTSTTNAYLSAVATLGANDTNFAQAIGTTISNVFFVSQAGQASNSVIDLATITNLQEVGPATNTGTLTVTGRFTNSVLTASELVGTDAHGALQSISLGTGLSFSGTTLNATASSAVNFTNAAGEVVNSWTNLGSIQFGVAGPGVLVGDVSGIEQTSGNFTFDNAISVGGQASLNGAVVSGGVLTAQGGFYMTGGAYSNVTGNASTNYGDWNEYDNFKLTNGYLSVSNTTFQISLTQNGYAGYTNGTLGLNIGATGFTNQGGTTFYLDSFIFGGSSVGDLTLPGRLFVASSTPVIDNSGNINTGSGNIIDGGTLSVSGASTLSGNLTVNGTTTTVKGLSVGGTGQSMHVTSGTSFVIDSGETNSGNTQIQGNLTVNGTKSFRITHPLDPSMWLLHASIESDEVMNLYRGRVITDANSNAIVTLPNWFAAENAPPYQFSLAVVGSFAQATIAVEPGGTLGGNAFAIQTSAPNTTVSWSLSGVRNDDAVRTNRMVVELKKTAL